MVHFYGSNFSGADLSNIKVEQETKYGASFVHCDFTKCKLIRAKIKMLNFIGSNFSDANFSQADSRGSLFSQAYLNKIISDDRISRTNRIEWKRQWRRIEQ